VFKEFSGRFAARYLEKVIGRMSKYVAQFDTIDMKSESPADKMQVFKMVLTCLDTIMRSSRFVPDEFRHIAAILKGVSGVRFNKRQATFNTLSGFFCLRFVTASLSFWEDPAKSPQKGKAKAKVAAPSIKIATFSQLLQTPLSLLPFGGNYATWNHHIIGRIFPDLLNFTFGLADCTELPQYPAPRDEVVRRALLTVVEAMTEAKDRLDRRSEQLLRNPNQGHPVRWALGIFLLSFFKDNIAA
jgi:hypothetical protein